MTGGKLDWRVRLGDLGEGARDVVFQAPDTVLDALATAIGVERVLACDARLHLAPRGTGADATGRVRARVVQTCGVSLEPFETDIDEAVDVRFVAERAAGKSGASHSLPAGEEGSPGMTEQPELLVNGVADLGAVVQEFLALGVDPYPRKPGIAFEAPAGEAQKLSPFASLSQLRPKGPGQDG